MTFMNTCIVVGFISTQSIFVSVNYDVALIVYTSQITTVTKDFAALQTFT